MGLLLFWSTDSHISKILRIFSKFNKIEELVVMNICEYVQQWVSRGKQKINVPFLQQDIESENVNVVKRLFKIQNINASTIRTVMVAHCRRHDNPDLLLDYEAQSQARRQKGQQQHHHQPLLFDLATSGSEEEEEQEEEEECQRGARSHGLPSPRLPQPTMSGLEHVIHVKNLFGFCFVFLAFSFF